MPRLCSTCFRPALFMKDSTATAYTPLRQAWPRFVHGQAGGLAPRCLNVLFQVRLGLSWLHAQDTAGSPTRRRPQTWRSLFFAPWTSHGVSAVSSRTFMNNAGQRLFRRHLLRLFLAEPTTASLDLAANH